MHAYYVTIPQYVEPELQMTKTEIYQRDIYQTYTYKLLPPPMLAYSHWDPQRHMAMLFKWICSEIQSWTTCYLKGIRSWNIYLRNSAIPPDVCYVYNRLYFLRLWKWYPSWIEFKIFDILRTCLWCLNLHAACYSPTRVTFLINHVNLIELHRMRHDTDVLSITLPQITRFLSHSYAKLYFS